VPLPVAPAAPVPLRPAARSRRFSDRRKRHQVVRFDRRGPAPVTPLQLEPVRELRAGRTKEHVVVHFEAKPHGRRDPGWEVLNEVEA
jgi:hypothetical protein